MKRSIKSLNGYTMAATDGEIGTVEDFYFDDESLTVRYVIVNTGYWWFGKKVLIPTDTLDNADWELKSFPINLTREEIRNSPDVDTEKPVSRQQEAGLHKYYGRPNYWSPGGFSVGVWGLTGTVPLATKRIPDENADSEDRRDYNVHLRSTQELKGYRIHGVDGKVGELDDFIIDDNTWKLHYLVIDTGGWLPGKRVLLSPKCIEEISWADATIFINLPADEIEKGPEYDPSNAVNVLHENLLYDYYGRPHK